MKKLLTFYLAFLGFSIQCSGEVEVPEALSRLIADPPSISGGDPERLKSQKVGGDGVVIEGDDFICYLSISAVEDFASRPFLSKSDYKYVTYVKKFDLVVRGMGEVTAKHISVSRPSRRPKDAELIDNGSQLEIRCGTFTVLWSSGDHVYFREEVRVASGTEDELWEKVEEFRKK